MQPCKALPTGHDWLLSTSSGPDCSSQIVAKGEPHMAWECAGACQVAEISAACTEGLQVLHQPAAGGEGFCSCCASAGDCCLAVPALTSTVGLQVLH